MNTLVKGSDAVAEFLKRCEVRIAFGIIGSANSHIYDSISQLGYTEVVTVHHEQAAVMAAGATFRVTGKIGAAIVTAGAGASNAITGVVSNWADSIPCIVIAGQEGTSHLREDTSRRMYGTQGFDAAKMVSQVTKYASCVMDASSLQDELETALYASTSARFGPVWLDIPFDVQAKVIPMREWKLRKPEPLNIPKHEVRAVVAELKAARRPIVLGGNGVRLAGAQVEFFEFATRARIPVTLTWSAIDVLPTSHSCYVGRWGVYGQRAANFCIQNADFVLVLGSRLAIPQVGYDFSQFARGARIVVVDVEKCKHPIDVEIRGDCKCFLDSMLEIIDAPWEDRDGWMERCTSLVDAYPLVGPEHKDDGFINSYKFMAELSKHLDEDHIIVTDMGTALLSGHQTLALKQGQSMFTSLGLGEMGYGLPGALGAAFAQPERNVLCLNCDGGIMMNLQELHTIIEHDLRVKIIIFNNDGYLMIKHTQQMLFKGKYVQVDKKTGVGLPDYSRLLPAFGYKYYSMRSWDESSEQALRQFFSESCPSVLEVFMHPEQPLVPKVKGVAKDDGSIVPAPIEDMSPLLPFEELESRMIVDVSERSTGVKRG